MNTKLSESNGEPCTWRHVSTVRGQALENLPSKDGKALSAEPTHIIFPLGGTVRGLGKRLDYRRESGRCGERDPGKGDHRGGFRGNELFRYLRGRELLFVQCPVCA